MPDSIRNPKSMFTAASKAAACLALLACLGLSGCVQANLSLFGEPGKPYKEQRLDGDGPDKVLLLGVDGLISEHTRGLLRNRPSTVQELVAQLKLAREDKDIKAVVLKVDSPGGSTTASDILYHELMTYKDASKVKMVAAMMGLAASGGYYVSLPADHILAHPTTITGSVGVIFLQPRVAGLMEKLGLGVDVSKSGTLKDMGSPFRAATAEEKRLVDAMTRAQATRFLELVQLHRHLDPAALGIVASARVFTAAEAKDLGLIDSVGYLDDALAKAKELAGLPKDATVVTYRRRENPDGTYYLPGVEAEGARPAVINLDLEGLLPPQAGLYYLWTPGYGQ
ncbi:MAG: signal peptide peptidase SppA [Humidesulfovibrio sp.]|uniref:signal peptide peptidase SppA n=1 Tax=Humidesulfovibrio sp. TaxID=2910988 RepID=UPI0027ECC5D1|nr:signal peptide peptidase SppA [Humidesulfovibrio sp.]MDQ7836321.1 signal peptide peptidase SppA [Humidesulfovibrio sp.]